MVIIGPRGHSHHYSININIKNIIFLQQTVVKLAVSNRSFITNVSWKDVDYENGPIQPPPLLRDKGLCQFASTCLDVRARILFIFFM